MLVQEDAAYIGTLITRLAACLSIERPIQNQSSLTSTIYGRHIAATAAFDNFFYMGYISNRIDICDRRRRTVRLKPYGPVTERKLSVLDPGNRDIRELDMLTQKTTTKLPAKRLQTRSPLPSPGSSLYRRREGRQP